MSRADSRPHPCNLWTSADVQRLPVIARRSLDYCWTGPDVNPVGITVFEPGVWAARIGEHQFSGETVLDMLVDKGFILFDKETLEVFVLRWFSFHKFDGLIGRNALRKGVREVRSAAILVEILRLADLAGVDVDEYKKPPANEINDLSTNTTSTSTSTSTSTTDTQQPASPGSVCLFFDELLWKTYPNKTSQQAARRAWLKLFPASPSPDDRQAILAGLERWLASRQWKNEGGRYVPSLKRWLEEKMWLETPLPYHNHHGHTQIPKENESPGKKLSLRDRMTEIE